MRIFPTSLAVILAGVALPLAAHGHQTRDDGPAPDPRQPPQSTIMAEPVAVMLAGFDTDLDGRITRAEAEAGVKRSFDAINVGHADGIGYIQFADWAQRWLGDRNALPSPFETDTNADNRITLAELDAKIMQIFDRLDRNHDGVLDHAELLTLDGVRRSGGGRGPRLRR